jgi:hypothetical protein
MGSIGQYVVTSKQEKTEWCWAASSKMAGEQYWRMLTSNYTSPRTVSQTSIATAVHGNDANTPAANITETVKAYQYVVENNTSTNSNYTYQSTALSDAQLFDRLQTKMQTIIARVSNSDSTAGHFIVISAFFKHETDTQVEIRDPWLYYPESYLIMDINALRNSGYRPGDGDYRTWNYTVLNNRTIQ